MVEANTDTSKSVVLLSSQSMMRITQWLVTNNLKTSIKYQHLGTLLNFKS